MSIQKEQYLDLINASNCYATMQKRMGGERGVEMVGYRRPGKVG